MNEAEWFLLVIAPVTLVTLAFLAVMGAKIAHRRFLRRDRELTAQIEAERRKVAARERSRLRSPYRRPRFP